MTPKVYSYVRMSTKRQADGSSEIRQSAPAIAYAAAVKMELDDSHRDIGVTGTGKNRKSGALSEFLEKIRTGEIAPKSTLYIETFDRLSREKFRDAYELVKSILETPINIYDAEDEYLYTEKSLDDPNRIQRLVGKLTASHEYSKRLSRRIKISKERVLQEAREEGRKLTKVCPGWLRKVGNEFEEIEDRVAVVRQLFAWALDGIGTPTMATRLNESKTPQFTKEAQGINVKKPVGGKGWSSAHISQILTSPAVYGVHQPIHKSYMNEDEERNYKVFKNGPPISDYYPIIIDKTLFDRVQQIRKANVKGANRNLQKPGSVLRNLFSGKAICQHCSGSMMLITSTKRKKGYLYCESNVRKNGCTAKGTFDYALLEACVLKRLALMDSQGLFRHSKPTASVQKLQAEADRLTVALEAGEAALQSWMGELLTDRMKRLRTAKEAELDAIEARLKDITRQLEEASTAGLADQASMVTLLRGQAEAGSVEARLKIRTALRSLLTSIEIDVVQKWCEVYCANDFIFTVYGNGYTADIETGGPAETMGRTFTINRPA